MIKQGKVVAFPTETVYGLGADARNASAIKKVFEIKGRPADNPLIVHISNKEQLFDFARNVPQPAKKLINEFWPGPLTLVLKKKPEVLDIITAGLDTVAIRMPGHKLAMEFISLAGPLVAPSANRSGRPSPTKAEHVKLDFGEDFPVIDGGSTEVGLESTVLDLSTESPTILRPGKIGQQEIEETLGVKVLFNPSRDKSKAPKSPGQKYSHYKPQASVIYGDISEIKASAFYLVQSGKYGHGKNILNYDGDLKLLSKELYDRFRQADVEGFDSVYIAPIEPFQNDFPSFYDALVNRINKATES